MTTYSLTRVLSSGARLIRPGALNQRKATQCYQRLRSMSALTHVSSANEPPHFHRSDPYASVQQDLKDTLHNIKTELISPDPNLNEVIEYYFNGESKCRPAVIILMAKTLNNHVHGYENLLLPKQREVAMIAEMLHIAGGFHGLTSTSDSSTRERIKLTEGKELLVGDFILSITTLLLSRIGNNEVYTTLCKIFGDQIQAEFMEDTGLLNADNEERVSHYLMKSFRKTGSLLAHSCRAVAILAGADPSVQELAFQYGSNLGITLQLVDDASKCARTNSIQPTIDDPDIFCSPSASKPMLFAPETSEGIAKRLWARQYCADAVRLLKAIKDSPEKQELLSLTNGFLNKQ